MDEETVPKVSKRKSRLFQFLILLVTVAIVATICGLVIYYVGVVGDGQGNTNEPALDSTSSPILPTTDSATSPITSSNIFYIGAARTDVTGPVVQVNMMGYAHPEQVANGLHTRLYSRAFVVADKELNTRVAFVSFDGGMTSQLIKLQVVKKLQEKHGDMFSERNVVISGTHTHSGPAGFFQFLLFEITSLGHVEQSTTAFVDGITESIELANSRLELGKIRIGSGLVNEGNINRSPTSYLLNPESERARYTHDTEQEITVLGFETLSGDPVGMLSWYPVHPTSMNFTNLLINSDNKGRASTLFEKMMRKPGETLGGQESFVAAFAQANLGDVSPRTKGPICFDTGLECEPLSSTCNGRSQNCTGFGPGKDMFDSTDIIARRQLDAAKGVYENATEVLDGPVSWVHQYVDMTSQSIKLDDGTTANTCKPGMGYSFAAGCTDGAGAFDFVQGMTRGTAFWNTIRDTLAKFICTVEPPKEYYDCHKPKPVLLPTGYMDIPYEWHPTTVDIQLLRIGQLVIAAVPGEYTTMAGRRLKEKIHMEAISQGMGENTKVVLAGLTNVYTHYITTPEEYVAQIYEAASTIFGPHTFQVYQEKFSDLVFPLVSGNKDDVDLGPSPELKQANQSRIAPLPGPDKVPAGVNFGDIIDDVNATYSTDDVVVVKFHAANPRHDMKLGSTYLEVERLVGRAWKTVYTDADWSTKFSWEEKNSIAPPADLTLFTTLSDVVAEATGVRFDIDLARQLHESGVLFTGNDVNDDDVIAQEVRHRLLQNMWDQNVLRREQTNYADVTAVESYVTIEWDIPVDEASGTYRIVYHGDYMDVDGSITPFTGTTSEFDVA
uniref:putative neutral ceramidase C isoform X1 n=1 Tax=Ciona intestinalis TaxID=7719 RepID=UPI000180C06E|nr:putative neutral ceramidase C isoform X1 [Ciona intestinalis]|eukprot:XP_002121814.1 putative neutral ceramidase C isoform X1 [Ciona intestinalis]